MTSPIIGKDNETSVYRQFEIFDLITLVIKEISSQLEKPKADMQKLSKNSWRTLRSEMNSAAAKKCKQGKAGLQKEIILSKYKKFDQDARDYEQGTVFKWKQNNDWRCTVLL